MQRDMDLIRLIMRNCESRKLPHTFDSKELLMRPTGDHVPADELIYHVKQLVEAGYIAGQNVGTARTVGPGEIRVDSVTWAGHDFLAATRNDGVWNAFKEKAGPHLRSLSFEVIKTTCAEIGKTMLLGA
jgi:hypothetical protein